MNKMTYAGYTTQMEFDTDDKITFHGTSVAEFEAAFHAAIDSAAHAAAVKASARSGQSLNKWAEQVLRKAAHA